MLDENTKWWLQTTSNNTDVMWKYMKTNIKELLGDDIGVNALHI